MKYDDRIQAQDLETWAARGIQYRLVDVREPWEREERHIGGIHIPLSEVIRRAEEIRFDGPIVLYCRRGVRSRIAIQRLKTRFPDWELFNLEGGIG